MAGQYRRVVTGHTPGGQSTVLFDSLLPLTEHGPGVAGTRQEDRIGTASSVAWTTHGFPADNTDESIDAGSRKVDTADSDGTVFRMLEYAPGVTPRHHRTDSIDYGIVLSGSIEMQLDTETVRLNAGDVIVQRGTVHNWINSGTEPCRIAYNLVGANPVVIDGVPLPAKG